jgi:hypothetical protein
MLGKKPKYSKSLENRAKTLGIRTTTGSGKARKYKTVTTLKEQVARRSKPTRLTQKQANVCGRNLGRRGGRAKAGKSKY